MATAFIQCGKCGNQVNMGSKFCSNCGCPMPNITIQEAAPVAPPPPMVQVVQNAPAPAIICHDCGASIPPNQVVRKTVKTGKSNKYKPGLLGGKWEHTTHHDRVNLCPACAQRRGTMTAVGIIFGIIIILVFFVIVAASKS